VVQLPEGTDMAHRLLRSLVSALRDTPSDAAVHFHAGEQGRPYVCYDARCGSPSLDVRAS
jgi:hypothetical protein